MSLENFNHATKEDALSKLLGCCTSKRWANQLADARPFASFDDLLKHSDAIWAGMQEVDLLEAFDGHPQIGDIKTLKQKYQHTVGKAADEQSGASTADKDTLQQLAQGNKNYLDKFGFIFIVFATGKSARQMLSLLHARLPNDRDTELKIASIEQNKITHLRLKTLLEQA